MPTKIPTPRKEYIRAIPGFRPLAPIEEKLPPWPYDYLARPPEIIVPKKEIRFAPTVTLRRPFRRRDKLS